MSKVSPRLRVGLGIVTVLAVVGLLTFVRTPVNHGGWLAGGQRTTADRPSPGVPSPLPAGPDIPAATRASQQLIVSLTDSADSAEALATELGLTADSIEFYPETRTATIRVSEQDRPVLRSTLETSPLVASVEDDEIIHLASTTPNDPNYSSQSGSLELVRAPQAWDYVQGKTSAVIAIVDTGIDGTHEDLSSKLVAGKNVITGASLAAGSDSDDNGHGTNVSGVAAAVGNNRVGIAGVDWRARIMPVKAFDSSGVATTSDVVEAIEYATGQGATVISMSFGRSTASDALTAAINTAWARGIILVAASGNDSRGSVSYPAANDHVIAVGSHTSGSVRSNFSNYGPELDVVAPGEGIYTTKDGGGYTIASGTSLATPFVAAGATLLKDFHSSAPNGEIVDILLRTARTVSAMGSHDRTDEYGFGALDLEQGVEGGGNYAATPVTWSSSDGPFVYPSIDPGERGTQLSITVRNTGQTRWFRDIVHLGTSGSRDRVPAFLRESGTGSPSGWTSPNRISMAEASVAPGETATFTFWMQAGGGTSPSTYDEHFELVADGIGWFGPDIWWRVTVRSLLDRYQAAPTHWSTSDGNYTYPTLQRGGVGKQFSITVRNTGSVTWTRGLVNLGTAQPRDREPVFLRESRTGSISGWLGPNRVEMVEASVVPGATATFAFWMAAPALLGTGTYPEHFQLVADGIGWFGPDIWWDVTVQ